tara:strand:+ start:354 stop:569 length:216 start_codon:yes stop_codon:yes gene_type:complete
MSWEHIIKINKPMSMDDWGNLKLVTKDGFCRKCKKQVKQGDPCPINLPSKAQAPQGPYCPQKIDWEVTGSM